MSDAFIREVDEDLRQKQLNSLWKKYGKFIIGIAIGIVVIVGGRAIYYNVVESKYIEQATAFSNALKSEAGSISTALDPLLTGDVDGYEIIAAFKKAELAVNDGNDAAAAEIFDQFIASSTVPQIYKDLAAVQASLLVIDTETTDQIRSRLALILNGDSGYRYLAEELVALSELRSGDVDGASTRFKALTENLEVSGSIKARVEQYLSIIE